MARSTYSLITGLFIMLSCCQVATAHEGTAPASGRCPNSLAIHSLVTQFYNDLSFQSPATLRYDSLHRYFMATGQLIDRHLAWYQFHSTDQAARHLAYRFPGMEPGKLRRRYSCMLSLLFTLNSGYMNTGIIQQVYAAFRAKDLQTIKSLQADNAEWSVAGPADKIPWATPRYGPEGAAEFLKILGSLLLPEVFEVNDFLERENKVVVLGYQKGTVQSTGDAYAFDFVHLWELHQGKVIKFRVYYDSYYVAHLLNKNEKVT